MLNKIKSISGVEKLSKRKQQTVKGGIPPQCRTFRDCNEDEECYRGRCVLIGI